MTQQEIDLALTNFRSILANHMPIDFGYQHISFEKSTFSNRIVISFAPSFQMINKVKGQYPHRVSLWLNTDTLEFETINLGGMGERSLTLTTQTNYSTDFYHIPFRKPKKNLINIYIAFDKFCERYVEGLKFYLPTLAYKRMLSPAANKMLGLPLYTIEPYSESENVLKSSDDNMLAFVAMCIGQVQEYKVYSLVYRCDLAITVRQYIELWYQTEAENKNSVV